MRDGAVAAADRASGFDRDKLVAAMGGPAASKMGSVREHGSPRGSTPVRVRVRSLIQNGGIEFVAHQGEVVGLAGLSGHGQTELLLSLFRGATQRRPGIEVTDPVALIAGDRQADGIFPLWTIAENIGVRSIRSLRKGPLISFELEDKFAERWRQRVKIRTANMRNNILSLSGGNQQKALFARALGSEAKIVLMDDPMRGVDVGTKVEVYVLIRAEADAGRTFLWYTTEMEELKNCDHVYVFRNHRIVADLSRSELSEERVIQSSFQEAG
jgi:ribose transport system ATP-binding protein